MFAFFLVVVRWTLNDWPVVIIQKCQGGNSKYYNGQILHLAPCYMIYIFIAGRVTLPPVNGAGGRRWDAGGL